MAVHHGDAQLPRAFQAKTGTWLLKAANPGSKTGMGTGAEEGSM